MMFPGYATMYKDDNSLIHLYFFPGINDDGSRIYEDLVLSKCKMQYEEITYSDNAKEYIFDTKNIVKITCRLYNSTTGKTTNVDLIA